MLGSPQVQHHVSAFSRMLQLWTLSVEIAKTNTPTFSLADVLWLEKLSDLWRLGRVLVYIRARLSIAKTNEGLSLTTSQVHIGSLEKKALVGASYGIHMALLVESGSFCWQLWIGMITKQLLKLQEPKGSLMCTSEGGDL